MGLPLTPTASTLHILHSPTHPLPEVFQHSVLTFYKGGLPLTFTAYTLHTSHTPTVLSFKYSNTLSSHLIRGSSFYTYASALHISHSLTHPLSLKNSNTVFTFYRGSSSHIHSIHSPCLSFSCLPSLSSIPTVCPHFL